MTVFLEFFLNKVVKLVGRGSVCLQYLLAYNNFGPLDLDYHVRAKARFTHWKAFESSPPTPLLRIPRDAVPTV